jgi:hypothetical protein
MIKNENLMHLMNKRKSRQFVDKIAVNVEKKKEKIEKIKNLLKETKKEKNNKELANTIIENYSKGENKQVEVINKDLSTQEENFKKRLEERRLRGNSQPHMVLKVK